MCESETVVGQLFSGSKLPKFLPYPSHQGVDATPLITVACDYEILLEAVIRVFKSFKKDTVHVLNDRDHAGL